MDADFKNNPLLKEAAQDIKNVEPRIKQAEEFMNMLDEAGEDTTEHRKELRTLKTRASKWQQTLRARGLM